MKKTNGLLSALLLQISLCSCDLNFGDDVEVSGARFDAEKLEQISTLTGLNFPAGSTGLEYVYSGSGIDDSMAAKIRIPDSKVAEFMKNEVFSVGEDAEASVQIGRGKPWWTLGELADRNDRTQKLPNVQFLEITTGRLDSEFVVFVSWFTI